MTAGRWFAVPSLHLYRSEGNSGEFDEYMTPSQPVFLTVLFDLYMPQILYNRTSGTCISTSHHMEDSFCPIFLVPGRHLMDRKPLLCGTVAGFWESFMKYQPTCAAYLAHVPSRSTFTLFLTLINICASFFLPSSCAICSVSCPKSFVAPTFAPFSSSLILSMYPCSHEQSRFSV